MSPVSFIGIAGGGGLGLMSCPGRKRELAQDVARIIAAGAGLVVSLTAPGEAAGTRTELPALLAQAGIHWQNFPIADFDVPDERTASLWPALARDIHARLDAGGRVLLHCWSGRGRSGMIALRLMVERGEAPAAALERLRRIRPGAVETEAQRLWATAVPGAAVAVPA